MARIRREQLNQMAQRQGDRRRRETVDLLTRDDDQANVDANSGDVLLEDSRGNVSRLEVTASSGLTGLTTPEGRTWRIQRNRQGLVSRLHAPGDTSLHMEYAPNGDLSQLAINDRSVLKLDKQENAISATYADGATEQLEITRDGIVGGATNALGNKIAFTYNPSGQVVAVNDANGNSTKFTYDEDGFCEGVHFPDGPSESYDVTENGQLEVLVDGQPHFHVNFNDADDIESVSWSDGHQINLQIDDDGRPVTGSNAKHEVKYSYGDNGLLASEEQDGGAIGYEYDGEDNLVSLKTPFEDECRYQYDGDNLIREIIDWDGRIYSFAHHQNGQLSTIRFPNGVVTEIQCHATGEDQSIRSVSSSGTAIVEDSYTYDERGRVASLSRQDEQRTYQYDTSGQLLSVQHRHRTAEQFTYDPAGNRISSNGNIATFDQSNRMLTCGEEKLTFDKRGNLVQQTGARDATYTWNGQDHLVEATTIDDERAVYTYDAFGRRLTKTVGQNTTTFVWAGRQLLHEITTTDSDEELERRDYLYLPGQHLPLAVRINGELHCYHTDRLGTVIAMTDSEGQVVWQADYDAWGQAIVVVDKVRQPLRLLGQYHDAETNLHYNLFRYYDPRLGRYLTPDPIRFEAGTLNLYQFANNDPVNQSDPEGHLAFLAAVAIVAGAALIGGLIGGAISAAMAPEGQRMGAFAKGFGWGALAGAVGAAVPIVGAAAGLGAAAIGGIAVAADAVIGGIEACSEGGSFLKGAGISLAMTVGTLGLAKIPGVKIALGAVGKKLGRVADKVAGRVKQAYYKARPGELAKKRAQRKAAEKARKAAARRKRLGAMQSPDGLLDGGTVDFADINSWASGKGLADEWGPSPNFPSGGFKYKHSDGVYDYSIHGHGVNPNAVANFPGSNSAVGPTASVYRKPVGGGPKQAYRTDGTWGSFASDPNGAHIPLTGSPY